MTKLAKTDLNPVLQLTKCIIPPVQNDMEVYMDETDNHDDQDDLLDEHDYEPIIAPRKFLKNVKQIPCGFCPLIFLNPNNHRQHIQTAHIRKKSSAGHLIKACEYCGAMRLD